MQGQVWLIGVVAMIEPVNGIGLQRADRIALDKAPVKKRHFQEVGKARRRNATGIVGMNMDNVKVFDISGRLLLEKKAIDSNATTFTVGETNQVLVVKITSDDNKTVIRKVIN